LPSEALGPIPPPPAPRGAPFGPAEIPPHWERIPPLRLTENNSRFPIRPAADNMDAPRADNGGARCHWHGGRWGCRAVRVTDDDCGFENFAPEQIVAGAAARWRGGDGGERPKCSGEGDTGTFRG